MRAKIAGKCFPICELRKFLGFREPVKANLSRNLGRHWGSPKATAFCAVSAFSCPHFPRFPCFWSVESPQTLVFFWGERERLHFPHFRRIGFESLIRKSDRLALGLPALGDRETLPLTLSPPSARGCFLEIDSYSLLT